MRMFNLEVRVCQRRVKISLSAMNVWGQKALKNTFLISISVLYAISKKILNMIFIKKFHNITFFQGYFNQDIFITLLTFNSNN